MGRKAFSSLTVAATAAFLCFYGRPGMTGTPAEQVEPTTPTEIVVRVISRGAKFVGSSMGGVRVTVRDAVTGELLADGVTAGSTGDTERIMGARPRQGDVMATGDAAVFRTVLDLSEPRLVEVAAYGPLAQRQSANRTSQTQFVVPGKHINQGDAWLLELPGLIVDVLEPPAHIKLQGMPQPIALRANVAMMCGCPIAPDDVWDARRFEVAALLKRDGVPMADVPLEYAGTPSQFSAALQVTDPGVYEAVVYAWEPANGNTGLDTTTFIIETQDAD